MTLLEFLVKELPWRGGWPKGAAEFFIHNDAQERGYFYNDRGQGGFGDQIDTKSVKYIQNCLGDIPGYNVTREQYEAALAAQQPVWNGEGLPPVGCECEYIGKDTSWGKVKVIGYDGLRVVFKPSGEDYYGITPGDNAIFRPLRSETERKREDAINAIALAYYTQDKSGNYRAEKGVYEDIAAGKIPGVELSK